MKIIQMKSGEQTMLITQPDSMEGRFDLLDQLIPSSCSIDVASTNKFRP